MENNVVFIKSVLVSLILLLILRVKYLQNHNLWGVNWRFDSLAVVDKISTDLACARGPSAAAKLQRLEREQTDRQTDKCNITPYPRPARSIQPTCAIEHQNLLSALLPANGSFPMYLRQYINYM